MWNLPWCRVLSIYIRVIKYADDRTRFLILWQQKLEFEAEKHYSCRKKKLRSKIFIASANQNIWSTTLANVDSASTSYPLGSFLKRSFWSMALDNFACRRFFFEKSLFFQVCRNMPLQDRKFFLVNFGVSYSFWIGGTCDELRYEEDAVTIESRRSRGIVIVSIWSLAKYERTRWRASCGEHHVGSRKGSSGEVLREQWSGYVSGLFFLPPPPPTC